MEGEVITKLLAGLRKTAENLPDRRKASNGRKYETADFLMSAFAVFYFQHPSMKEKKEIPYKNSWITDIEISKGNGENVTDCARARWKTENAHNMRHNMRHNNVLKNRGYNPEHSFGHGKEHANGIFCLLNLFAFLVHGIQRLIDDDCRKAYDHASRKIDFFWALRYEASRYFHKNWVSLFLTVSGHPPDG